MRNPFSPQPHPKNPTPGSSGNESSTSDPDRTTGRLRSRLQGKVPKNPTPAAEPRVTGRRMGESHKDVRRRRNG